jgi:hypothetical protein
MRHLGLCELVSFSSSGRKLRRRRAPANVGFRHRSRFLSAAPSPVLPGRLREFSGSFFCFCQASSNVGLTTSTIRRMVRGFSRLFVGVSCRLSLFLSSLFLDPPATSSSRPSRQERRFPCSMSGPFVKLGARFPCGFFESTFAAEERPSRGFPRGSSLWPVFDLPAASSTRASRQERRYSWALFSILRRLLRLKLAANKRPSRLFHSPFAASSSSSFLDSPASSFAASETRQERRLRDASLHCLRVFIQARFAIPLRLLRVQLRGKRDASTRFPDPVLWLFIKLGSRSSCGFFASTYLARETPSTPLSRSFFGSFKVAT